MIVVPAVNANKATVGIITFVASGKGNRAAKTTRRVEDVTGAAIGAGALVGMSAASAGRAAADTAIPAAISSSVSDANRQ